MPRHISSCSSFSSFSSSSSSCFLFVRYCSVIMALMTLCQCDCRVIMALMTVCQCDCVQLPFMHESLLLDDKHQKLTRFEKHMAQQSYEHDKMKSGRLSARTYSPPQIAARRPYSPPLPPLPPDPPYSPAVFPDRLLSVSFNVVFLQRWQWRWLHVACNAVCNQIEIAYCSLDMQHFYLVPDSCLITAAYFGSSYGLSVCLCLSVSMLLKTLWINFFDIVARCRLWTNDN